MQADGLKLINKYRQPIMGVAALFILFFHEWEYVLENIPVLSFMEYFVKRVGFYGVDIFFLLSGIGLTYSVKKGSTLSFYGKRLKRIVFPFFAVAILRALLEKWSFALFVGNITGVRFFTVDMYSFLWFVPAIVTFYLVFPWYYKLFEKASNKTLFTAMILMIWLFLEILLDGVLRADLYGFTNRIPVFLIGVLLGYMSQTRERDYDKWDYGFFWVMLLLGIYLSYKVNFWGMPFVVPTPNCCFPTTFMGIATAFLLAKGLHLCDAREKKHPLGEGIIRMLSLIGNMTLELYCVQEWLGGLLKNRFQDMRDLFLNIMVYIVIFVAAYLLHVVSDLFWDKACAFSRKNK